MGWLNKAKKKAKKLGKKAKKAAKKAKKIVEETVENVVEAAVSVPVAIIDDVVDTIDHVGDGIVNLLQGDVDGAKSAFGKAAHAAQEAIGDVYWGPVGATAMILVHTVSGAQRLVGAQPEPRGLASAERRVLEAIFGDSLAYDEIRLIEGKLGLLQGARYGARSAPYTIGHSIYVPSASLDPKTSRIPITTLVHEAAHVWQFENGGPDYIVESLWAQATGDVGTQSVNRGYDFDNALAEGKRWGDFGPEQQAAFVEYAFEYPIAFTSTPLPGVFEVPPGGHDYMEVLTEAIDLIRDGAGAA